MALFTIQMIKIAVCFVAMGFVALYWLQERGVIRRRGVYAILLAVLAVFSVLCYFDFGQYPKHGRFMNPHGWFHYYLGAKYSKELGYENLYRAVIIADRENTGMTVQKKTRNLSNYLTESTDVVLRRAADYRNLFTPARWAQFRTDVAYFRSIFIPRRWPGVVTDKGYNGTPTWNLVGGMLANTVPTSNRAGMLFLLSLDFILAGAMIALVWRAFGRYAALLATVYLCTHFAFFAYNVNEIRGAFLRLDWVAFSVIGVCLLKLDRYKTAGALMAYAALARIFPVVLVFGVGVKFLQDLFVTRKINSRYFGFFAAFAVTAAILVGASIAWTGLEFWQIFLEKIRMHDQGISSQRTGFRYVFMNLFTGGAAAGLERHKIAWWAVQACMLVVCSFCVLRLKDYEALAFSYVPLFFLAAPTTYYHIGLLVPLMMFLPKMETATGAAGVAFMFAITALFTALNNVKLPGGTWQFSMLMSCVLLALMLYMVALALLEWRKKPAVVADAILPQKKRRARAS